MTTSWIIKEKDTGKIIAETFKESVIARLDKEKHEAVPIREYLASLNKRENT